MRKGYFVTVLALVISVGMAHAQQPASSQAADPKCGALPGTSSTLVALPAVAPEAVQPTSPAGASSTVSNVAAASDLARILGISAPVAASVVVPECAPDYGQCAVYGQGAYCCVLCNGACGCTAAARGLLCP